VENELQHWNVKLVELSVITFALYCKSDDTSYDELLQWLWNSIILCLSQLSGPF